MRRGFVGISIRTLVAPAAWLLLSLIAARCADVRADDRRGLELFEARIRPVLVERCQECHASGGVMEGGFAVDSHEALRRGGRGGAVIVPGDPAASRLMAILRHEIAGLEMPDGGGRLDDATLAAFDAWIAAGAPDPRAEPAGGGTAIPTDVGARRNWWSFHPLTHVDPPPARSAEWDTNPIDRFLAARLDAAGLEPAPPADPATLLRRVSFVLTGLPPPAEEVRAFSADPSPRAFEAAVDRLLASPRFGERFARHWMDLVRYCESHGSQGDPELPDAWRYRDWLVRAFNADLPYDRFVLEQIAGDLLPDPRRLPDGTNESAIGPAHLRMVELGFVPVDALDDRLKVIENQIDVHTKTFFALTAACARCHDHKFDPVTQEDYTALAGIFGSCRPGHVLLDAPESLGAADAEAAALVATIRAGLAEAWLEVANRLASRLFDARGRLAAAEATRVELATTSAAIDAIEAPARLEALSRRGPSAPAWLPVPFARWSFSGDARDSIGGHHGDLLGGAVVRDGRLVLDGVHANVRTAPLDRRLVAKTFEAWVTLSNLGQRGGGVIGVDVPEGRFFDSIVFGELKPGHWLPGSDFFNRTQDPEGPAEMSGPDTPVHVAISWAADGRVTVFRDGVRHGTSYLKAPARSFEAGASRFLFGQRLSDIDPPFAGTIDEARAYDRALSEEEVAASFQAGPEGVADEELLAVLPHAARGTLATLRDRRSTLVALLREGKERSVDALDATLAAAAGDATSPFHAVTRLAAAAPDQVADIWTTCRAAIEAERRAIFDADAGVTTLWDLRGTDLAGWTRHGSGVPERPAAEGAFAVAPEGDAILTGILPAGVHTHLAGAGRPALLQSPAFTIDTDSVFLRVHGRGSVARLVIEGYPLGNGGIYPAVRPERDDMAWIRLDTNYRRGARAYVELAADPSSRASFGIAAVARGDGPSPPRERGLAAAPFLDGYPPTSVDDLERRMARRLGEVVVAWRDGALDEDGRALLDRLVRAGILPVSLGALPALAETVERFRALERDRPAATRAPGVLEAQGEDQPLLVRGQHTRPAGIVPRRGLSLFGTAPFGPDAIAAGAPSGRLQLAEEALGPGRDLLARVMVNRLWHHVFGRGIVATTDNLGRLGALPSHPELLDHLAMDFIADGWSVKRALGRMVTTRAFRGSSRPPPRAAEVDPLDDLLSHARVRRLDAESIRDTILLLSGELDTTSGGPGIDPWHAAKTEGGGPVGPLDGNRRRSLYLRVRRNASHPLLEVFDAPKPTTTRGTRDVTSGPAQSLTMENDPFVIDQAAKWGARVAASPGTDADRVRMMLLCTLSREPDAEEIEALLGHLTAARAAAGDEPAAAASAWAEVAHAILGLKETIHVE